MTTSDFQAPLSPLTFKSPVIARDITKSSSSVASNDVKLIQEFSKLRLWTITGIEFDYRTPIANKPDE